MTETKKPLQVSLDERLIEEIDKLAVKHNSTRDEIIKSARKLLLEKCNDKQGDVPSRE